MAKQTVALRPTKKKPMMPKKASSSKLNKKSLNQKTDKKSNQSLLDKALLLHMHDLMVKSRKLEERLIQIYKKGESYFWIGGPGEEAFGVALGLLAKKGQGPEYDFMHLHYRCTPTLIAMGMDMRDSIRLMMNRSTDPSTGGRNFSNHYCFPEMNILPVTSPIEVQYGIAIGTGIAQARRKTDAITIVTGGDAGTAEGDFASCLVWSSRPALPLPIYMTVQNNKWGISTDYDAQHGEKNIAERGKPFGMRTGVYNGNDPIESYLAIKADIEYIRKNRRPVLSEFRLSRLFGHSSASGANRIPDEDCIELFEAKLMDWGYLTKAKASEIHQKYEDEARQIADEVREEPVPQGESVWDYTYANSENADWRKF